MSNTNPRTGEILFVKCVKDGIPNRDPLRDSDARRLFGEEDGRISLSDVSIKRDVRDYVLLKYPGGGEDKTRGIFVREDYAPDGQRLGRQRVAEKILAEAGRSTAKIERDALMELAFDARVFGTVFSVSNNSFHDTGPVQFGWAHSLHPVDTKYVQGTVLLRPKEAGEQKQQSQGSRGGQGGKRAQVAQPDAGETPEKLVVAGSMWSTYMLPFAVFAMPGVVSGPIAQRTKMRSEDMDLVLEGLWKGTLARQARGRGFQQPLLLLHVEYTDPFFRIGFLEDGLRLEPGRDMWQGKNGPAPTSLMDVTLNVQRLDQMLRTDADKIARVRVWHDPRLRLAGSLRAESSTWSQDSE